MGYYNDISNNKDLAAQNVAQYNRMRGISGHTTAGVVLSQTLPSVFMTLTAKINPSFCFYDTYCKNPGMDKI